ncbi:transcriptional regulator, partial [Haemophilus parainfluenzae]
DRQWIWYTVRSEALKSLIDFLFEECCTRNQVVEFDDSGHAPCHSGPSACCD